MENIKQNSKLGESTSNPLDGLTPSVRKAILKRYGINMDVKVIEIEARIPFTLNKDDSGSNGQGGAPLYATSFVSKINSE